MPRKTYVCTDCPEDNAIEYYKQRGVARDHAERTGHNVEERTND